MSNDFKKSIIYDSIDLLNQFINSNIKYNDLLEEDRARVLYNRDHLIISLNNSTNDNLSDQDINAIQVCLNKVKVFIQNG